jgi:hypothetical protein
MKYKIGDRVKIVIGHFGPEGSHRDFNCIGTITRVDGSMDEGYYPYSVTLDEKPDGKMGDLYAGYEIIPLAPRKQISVKKITL